MSRLCWGAEWGKAEGPLDLCACSIVRFGNQIVCVILRVELFLGVVLCGCVSWEVIADPCRTRKCSMWAERRRL